MMKKAVVIGTAVLGEAVSAVLGSECLLPGSQRVPLPLIPSYPFSCFPALITLCHLSHSPDSPIPSVLT